MESCISIWQWWWWWAILTFLWYFGLDLQFKLCFTLFIHFNWYILIGTFYRYFYNSRKYKCSSGCTRFHLTTTSSQNEMAGHSFHFWNHHLGSWNVFWYIQKDMSPRSHIRKSLFSEISVIHALNHHCFLPLIMEPQILSFRFVSK